MTDTKREQKKQTPQDAMKEEILKSLNIRELQKRGNEIYKNFFNRLISNPEDVWGIFDNTGSEISELSKQKTREVLESMGIEAPPEQPPSINEEFKNFLINSISTLEMLSLMLPPKEISNEFSSSINELFNKCERKDREKLDDIFQESRIELLRKAMSSWQRSFKIVIKSDLPIEARIDNKFRAVKSLSEGIYRELLFVIQEMAQIVFGYAPVDNFGVIIDQLEKNTLTQIFVNRVAYDIRNAESHENIILDAGKIHLFDKNSHPIRSLNEYDLDKTIDWLVKFTEGVIYSLQKNYLFFINVKPENRVDYIVQIFVEKLLAPLLLTK